MFSLNHHSRFLLDFFNAINTLLGLFVLLYSLTRLPVAPVDTTGCCGYMFYRSLGPRGSFSPLDRTGDIMLYLL